MMEYFQNPWIASVAIFITQIAFLYFRTLNLRYVAEGNTIMAILSGNGVGIAWLISTTMGVSAISMLDWQPIAAFLIGGSIGTYYGLKKKK